MTFHSFSRTLHALEFDDPAIELDLVLDEHGIALAYWCDDSGAWLGDVEVGDA